jgi:hypothetical protein
MEYSPIKYKIKKSIPILLILVLAAILFLYRGQLFGGLFKKESQKTSLKSSVGSDSNAEKKLSVADEKILQEKVAVIIKGGDLNTCDEIENDMYRNVCRNNILLNKIQETKDIKLCRELDGKLVSVESCERNIIMKESLEKGDISVCSQASSVNVRKMCQQNVWIAQAVKNNDIGYCQNLKLDEEKMSCEDIFYFGSIFQSGAENFDCQKFHQEDMRSDCLVFKNNPASKSPDFCAGMKTALFSQLCSGNNPQQ